MPTLIRRANAPAARVRATAERANRQARRLQAADLFTQGARAVEVARQLGVSKQSASRWHAAWTAGGALALHSKGPHGVRPRLSAADLERLAAALAQGASAYGFTGEVWTLRRIAQVVQRQTGVRYHIGHLWAILYQRMGWSVQRPVRRAAERDEAAIRRWVADDWPRIKQTPAGAKPDSSSSTSPARVCYPTCAAPGRRSAIRRCCDIRSTGSAPRWRRGCASALAVGAARCSSTSRRAATTLPA
jgi:transposase